MFFSRYFSGSLELQREQPAQAGAVLGARRRRARRRPRSRHACPCRSAPESRPAIWPPLLHFHQLGQLAEGPGGVAAGAAAGARRRGRLAATARLRAAAGLRATAAALRGCSLQRRQRLERRRAPARPARPSAPPGCARMPSCRPCSSTTRKFISRCGASVSSLKSLRCTCELGALAHALSAARRAGCPARTRARRRTSCGVLRQRHEPRARAAGAGSSPAPAPWPCSMPGTSHSQRSSLTWLSA